MKFPDDTQTNDLFWMNDEPVKVTAWNYLYGLSHNRYFDIEFLSVMQDNRSTASMTLIPMGYDFYGADIRRMSSLEKELF